MADPTTPFSWNGEVVVVRVVQTEISRDRSYELLNRLSHGSNRPQNCNPNPPTEDGMSRNIGRVNKREEALHNLEASYLSGRWDDLAELSIQLARRQRLLPVPCWEKQWVSPAGAAPGSTYKVMKWVKTDKKQVNRFE